MRDIINADEETQEVQPRVKVDDGSNIITFGGPDYGRVYELSLDTSIDNDSWSASMSFRNHYDIGPSLDPLDSDSDFNDGTISDQLMDQYHHVQIETSKDGGSNWANMFEGYVGDVTARREVGGNNLIDFAPFDLTKPLKDVVITAQDASQSPWTYNNKDVSTVIDEILSDQGFELSLNKDASDSPQFTVSEYKVKDVSVWEALKELATKPGFKLMFRPYNNDFVLTLVDPQRGTTDGRLDSSSSSWDPDKIISSGYKQREIDVSDKDVRTKVVVSYVDRDSGKRKEVSVSDADALAKYGAQDYGGNRLHRLMRLKEDDKSLIDTETEANSFAQYALDDLKYPSPSAQIDFQYFNPDIQIGDILRVGGADDYTIDLGVTDISHSLSVDDQIGKTTVQGTVNRVIAEKSYWLNQGLDDEEDIEQRGDGKPPAAPEHPPRLDKQVYQVESSGETRCDVVCYGEHASEWDILSYAWQYRIYRDSNWGEWQDAGKTDKDHPQTAIGSLAVGENRKLQVHYAPIDKQTKVSGGPAPWSPAQEIPLNGDATPPKPPSNVVAAAGPEKITLTWTNPTTDGNGSNLNDLDDVVVYVKKSSEPTKSDYDTRQEAGKAEKWVFDTTNVNTVYNFRLSAEDNSENESELTDNITASPNAKVGDGETPATPTGLSVANNYVDRQEDGTLYAIVELDWDDNTEEDLKGYELQQSTDGGSTWKHVSQSAPKASEATVKPLKPNTTYDYRIRAEDTEQNQSSWTSALSVTTTRDNTPPSTPSGLSATPDKGSVVLEWNEVSASDFKKYKVYIDTGESFIAEGTTFTYYGDYNTTYSFEVSAVDTSDNESAKAGPVSASPEQIFNTDIAFDALDLATDTLDDISDGATYGKVATTNISPNGFIELTSCTGTLDDISDGSNYGKVKTTQLSAGEIILAEAQGNLDDIADGSNYGKVKLTQISSGEIVLANVEGDLDDVVNGDNYGKVELTDITAGRIDLSYDGGQIKIGKNAVTTDQAGIVISDGTINRVKLGEVAGSEYGLIIQDSNGNDLLRSTSNGDSGSLGDTHIDVLSASSIDVDDLTAISANIGTWNIDSNSINAVGDQAYISAGGGSNSVGITGYSSGSGGADSIAFWAGGTHSDLQSTDGGSADVWIKRGGDFKFGNYAGGQGIKYDGSTLDIEGNLEVDSISVDKITGTPGGGDDIFGNLANQNSVDQYDITIDGSLAITGDIRSSDWDETNGWKIDGETDTIYAAEFKDTDGSPVVKDGTYQGVRTVYSGTAGTYKQEVGNNYTSSDQSTDVLTGESFTVPSGKKWVVTVNIAPDQGNAEYWTPGGTTTAPLPAGFLTGGAIDWPKGHDIYLGGNWIDGNGDGQGAVLTSGSYSNYDLRVFHFWIRYADASSNNAWATNQVFWEVLEIPA